MGDHRAEIKIEMSFHGVKDSCDMWINYLPQECCNMDKRVVDFINSVYERGMSKYDDMCIEYEEAEKKRKDLEELKRLKSIYEK